MIQHFSNFNNLNTKTIMWDTKNCKGSWRFKWANKFCCKPTCSVSSWQCVYNATKKTVQILKIFLKCCNQWYSRPCNQKRLLSNPGTSNLKLANQLLCLLSWFPTISVHDSNLIDIPEHHSQFVESGICVWRIPTL